jgi:hypothetical protein
LVLCVWEGGMAAWPGQLFGVCTSAVLLFKHGLWPSLAVC